MDSKTLAAKLNGRTYRDEISKEDAEIAKQNGLVVVFGASDDLMEFRGAIYDEVGCYDGGFAHLTKDGLLENDCDSEDCLHFAKIKASAVKIEAVWESEGYAWVYKTDVLHETFDILEDGDKYCRGIVFRLDEVKNGRD